MSFSIVWVNSAMLFAVSDVTRVDKFQDFYVLTQLSASANDKVLATCWGVYSQILCQGPTLKAPDAK